MGWLLRRHRAPAQPPPPPVPAWSTLPPLGRSMGEVGSAAGGGFVDSLAGGRALATAPMLPLPAGHPKVSMRAVAAPRGLEAAGGDGGGGVTGLVQRTLGRVLRQSPGRGRLGTDVAFASGNREATARAPSPSRPRVDSTARPQLGGQRLETGRSAVGPPPATVLPAPGVRAPVGVVPGPDVGPGSRSGSPAPAEPQVPRPQVGPLPPAFPRPEDSTARPALAHPSRKPGSDGANAPEPGSSRRQDLPAARRGLGPPRGSVTRRLTTLATDSHPGTTTRPHVPSVATDRRSEGGGSAEPRLAASGDDPVGWSSTTTSPRAAHGEPAAPAGGDSMPLPSALVRRVRTSVDATGRRGPGTSHGTAIPYDKARPVSSSTSSVVARRRSGQPDRRPGFGTVGRPARALQGVPPTVPPPPFAPPAVQRALGQPGAEASVLQPAAAQPPAEGEDDLDEVVEQLYERISRRLRSELLVDRERRGSLVDLR